MGNFRGTRCLGGTGTTYWPDKTEEAPNIKVTDIEDTVAEFLEEGHNYYDEEFLAGYECAIKDIMTAIEDLKGE